MIKTQICLENVYHDSEKKETNIPQIFLHFTQQQCTSSLNIHEYFCKKNSTFGPFSSCLGTKNF